MLTKFHYESSQSGRIGNRGWLPRKSVLERPVALLGVVLLPGLAQHSSTLQADGKWPCLGANSTVFDNGSFYTGVWQPGEAAFSGCALVCKLDLSDDSKICRIR